MSKTDTAVLSIDVQQSFPAWAPWRDDDVPAFRKSIVRLIEGAAAKGWPIVRILHENESGPFSQASGLVRPMEWMPRTHAVGFIKHARNAFTDTGLDRWLRTRGIRRVVVAGILTEQCCETTARVASDLGYEVDFVSEATLSLPRAHPDGRTFSAAEIRERTELVLHERFARIATVEQALAHE